MEGFPTGTVEERGRERVDEVVGAHAEGRDFLKGPIGVGSGVDPLWGNLDLRKDAR